MTRLLFVLFLGLVAVPLAGTAPAQAQSYSFSQVQIEGNRRIEAATILSYLSIPRGETVSASELNDAYQRLVGSGLFATVELLPRGRILVVKIEENPTINRISIEGNRRIKDKVLLGLLKSQPRLVFSPSTAEADANTIVKAYEEQGRLSVSVDPVIIRRANNRVDLVFEVQEAKNVEVERLSFVGNRAFSDSRLRRVLETKQAGILRAIIRADTFNPDRIAFDKQVLKDFYLSRGYIDFTTLSVNTELARERNGFFITFNVREGQQFKFGEITTSTDLPDVNADEFDAVSKLRSGTVYNPSAVDDTIARMERLAIQKGLDFVRVEPRITRNDRDQTLDIELVVTRGERIVVERIDIEGNATTLDRVVRRQFNVVEGDPFNPREIRAAAERIRALGFFSNADVQARQGSSPDNVIIDVNVDEQPTGSFAIGGVYSLEQGLGFSVSFSESNFLGRGQYLALNLTTGKDSGTFTFSFAEPSFLGRDLRFGLDAYYTQSTHSAEFYDTKLYHFEPSLGFPISENGRLRVSVFADGAEMLNYTGSSDVLIADAARGTQIGGGAGLQYSFDNRRTGLNPDAGIRLEFGVDLGGFGSDFQYASATTTATAQTKILNDEVTLRATLQGGALFGLNGTTGRVTDRFSLPPSQMRGFAINGIGPRDTAAGSNDALGGNYFAVARFEAEFPLGLPEEYGITGGVFVDVGSLWGLDSTAGTGGSTIDDSMHIRSVVGASLFWNTPIGPLRFNFTRAIQKESYDVENNFEFTISTQF